MKAPYTKPQWRNKKYRQERPYVERVPFYYWSILRAATELGVSERTITRRIAAGALHTRKVGGRVWIRPPGRLVDKEGR